MKSLNICNIADILGGMSVEAALDLIENEGLEYKYIEETDYEVGTLIVEHRQFEIEDDVILYGAYYI